MSDYSELREPLLLLIVIIALIIYLRYRSKKDQISFWQLFNKIARHDKGKLLIIAIIVLSMILFIAIPSLKNFNDIRRVYKSDMKFVEGRVTNYDPMPYQGHKNESFVVNGVAFQFSNFESAIGGYHDAASHGGVIRPNLYVRIGYYHSNFRNIILRLETE